MFLYIILYSQAVAQGCSKTLNEKQPCRHLEECPPKSYEPRYINVFPDTRDDNDNFNDYSSQWSQVGLVSRTLSYITNILYC